LPVSEQRCGGPGADAADAGDVVGRVSGHGAEVGPLRGSHPELGEDGLCVDVAFAAMHGGVENSDPLVDELVEVAVAGHDVDPPGHIGSGKGGDDVVGFLVIELDPGDALGIQDILDGRQLPDLGHRVLIDGTLGLVRAVSCLAGCGAVLAVENYDDLGRVREFRVGASAPQDQARRVLRLSEQRCTATLGWIKERNLAESSSRPGVRYEYVVRGHIAAL
jgi:hypothetical protein